MLQYFEGVGDENLFNRMPPKIDLPPSYVPVHNIVFASLKCSPSLIQRATLISEKSYVKRFGHGLKFFSLVAKLPVNQRTNYLQYNHDELEFYFQVKSEQLRLDKNKINSRIGFDIIYEVLNLPFATVRLILLLRV
jgi:hypothetical protein